jgi:hypothetical protein
MKKRFQRSTPPNPVSPLQMSAKGLPVEIIYGLPSRNCRGMGICQVKLMEDESQQAQCQCSSIAFARITTNTQLELNIIRSSVDLQQFQARFQNLEFIVDEPKALESRVCEALKVGPLELLAGKYPVQASDEFLQIFIAFRTLSTTSTL